VEVEISYDRRTFVSILTSSVGHGCLRPNSWVVPTSFSLSPQQWFPPNGASRANFRIELGVQMLLDRVCPGGGWNAGNGVVYGVPLAPHPDATAIALVALVTQTLNPTVQQSLDWLEHAVLTRSAPWSLAWALHRASIAPAVHPGATLSSVAIDRGKQDRRCRDSRRRCACSEISQWTRYFWS